MSIVAEILVSKGKAEIDDLKIKTNNLSTKINQLKIDSQHFLENKYVQFKSQLHENKNFDVKLEMVLQQMKQLNEAIETETKPELQNSTGELKSLSIALQEMNVKIHIIKQLVDLDIKLHLAKKELLSKRYVRVAQILCDIRDLLHSVHEEYDPEILKGLKTEVVLRNEAFLHEMTNIWRQSVICEVQKNNGNTHTCSIKMNISNQYSFAELIQALHFYDELEILLKYFSEKLIENMLTLLLQRQCNVNANTTDNNTILCVIVMNEHKDKPVSVIENLKKVFEFLFLTLEMPVDTSNNITLMNLLGSCMSEKFCDLFIKEILRDAIPSNKEERQEYDKVIESTTTFQQYLKQIGFVSSDNHCILQYAMNVDVHFANKLCELTMGQARNIMKKDLHDTIQTTAQSSDLLGVSEYTSDTCQTEHLDTFASLSSSTMHFPKCLISKSVLELLELIEGLLKDSSTSSDLRAVRLYCTALKIIEMYCAITPVHHKKFLDTLPQQAALLHNNCMYLAHQLLLLGPKFQVELSAVMPSHTFTFVDLVSSLRQTGSQAFLGQMQVQRKQLLDILRDSGLSNLGEGDRLPVTTEKCIRQCLRQLELLQRVWQPVLPSNVYNKAIGALLNTLAEELIVRISTAEDIPAETATDLVSVFNTVLDRAPRVLIEAGEVHQYVKRWRTLEELVRVLGANLQTIDDLWADGKGPLAHEFSADQVRQLVRALFQNTARRAAVLSKIK